MKEKEYLDCSCKNFALILSKAPSLTKSDVEMVSEITNLCPIIVHIHGERELKISRGFSRQLNALITSPACYSDFKEVLNRCRFSICENGAGALFSLFAKKPVFIDISDKNARHLIAQMTKKGYTGRTVFPYSKGGTGLISHLDAKKKKTLGANPQFSQMFFTGDGY